METRGPAGPSSQALDLFADIRLKTVIGTASKEGHLGAISNGGEREVQAESRQGIFDEVIGVGILNRPIGHCR